MDGSKWAKAAAVLCALASLSGGAAAAVYQNFDICARFARPDGSWSNNFQLNAQLLYGREISRIVKDAKVKPYSRYLLVKWKNGATTVLDIGNDRRPQMEDRSYRDEDGRQWFVRRGWRGCN
ncbi:MAG: hypothetical protein ACFWTZ_01655 [Burkholderia sp.]|jgi:hypothetical protein